MASGRSIVTLADHVDAQLALYCHCSNRHCRHQARLAWRPLLEQLGGDFPLSELRPRLRCSACGGRDVEISRVWVGHEERGRGTDAVADSDSDARARPAAAGEG